MGTLGLNHRPIVQEGPHMLLLFGFKTVHKSLPGRHASCQYCRSFVHHTLAERATKFTLFFIPLFTVSRKFQITCSNCGYISSISARERRAFQLQR
jgi:hypothetical protein